MKLAGMVETFRLKKSLMYLAMVIAAFCIAAIAGLLCLYFLEEPANHGYKGEGSKVNKVAVILIYFGFLLLAVYLWAAYLMERFTINGTTLWIRSVFQNHQFDVSELECLDWSYGSVVFHVKGGKSRLVLGNYSSKDQLKIITALYDLAPASIQKGWPDFCRRVALPLRDGPPPRLPLPGEPPPKYFMNTRRRHDRMAAIYIPLSILLAITLAVALDDSKLLVFPLPVVFMWLMFRFGVPPDGRMEVHLTSTYDGRLSLLILIVVVGVQLLLVGLRLFTGDVDPMVYTILIAVMAVVFPPLIYKLIKRERMANEQGANLALASIQKGRPEFCRSAALPLRDGQPPPASGEPTPKRFMNTRKRHDRMAAVYIPLSILLAIALMMAMQSPQFLLFPLFVVAAWLLLRFSVPADGKMELHLTSTYEGRLALLLGVIVVCGPLLLIGFPLMGVEETVAWWVIAAAATVASPPIIYGLIKQSLIPDQQKADLATEKWRQGHSKEGKA